MKERKERAGQKREEMWVKLSGWEWWVVGLGGGTRGPQNDDLHFFFFFTDGMLQDMLAKRYSTTHGSMKYQLVVELHQLKREPG